MLIQNKWQKSRNNLDEFAIPLREVSAVPCQGTLYQVIFVPLSVRC